MRTPSKFCFHDKRITGFMKSWKVEKNLQIHKNWKLWRRDYSSIWYPTIIGQCPQICWFLFRIAALRYCPMDNAPIWLQRAPCEPKKYLQQCSKVKISQVKNKRWNEWKNEIGQMPSICFETLHMMDWSIYISWVKFNHIHSISIVGVFA